jgi:hypothetical protein
MESEAFDQAVQADATAETVSDRVTQLSLAVDAAFNCVEICGQLRGADVWHADVVEAMARSWRQIAADFVIRRHELVENRRAELVELAKEVIV